jgi:hypothetical protein
MVAAAGSRPRQQARTSPVSAQQQANGQADGTTQPSSVAAFRSYTANGRDKPVNLGQHASRPSPPWEHAAADHDAKSDLYIVAHRSAVTDGYTVAHWFACPNSPTRTDNHSIAHRLANANGQARRAGRSEGAGGARWAGGAEGTGLTRRSGAR